MLESQAQSILYGVFLDGLTRRRPAMTRLIFSGILEKFPNLKFMVHHCGAMVPFFEQRIEIAYDMNEMRLGAKVKQGLTKPVIEYYRMFYADTAVHSKIAIKCGYDFFGPDHILFGTDMPYDNELGFRFVRQGVEAIEQTDIPHMDKRKIFADNARRLLRLPI